MPLAALLQHPPLVPPLVLLPLDESLALLATGLGDVQKSARDVIDDEDAVLQGEVAEDRDEPEQLGLVCGL